MSIAEAEVRAGVRSMTGFARLDGTLADGRGYALAIKSVNHRHLDLSVRAPGMLDALEPALRKAVKARVRRGHVELTVSVERAAAAGTIALDERLLEAYVSAFRRTAKTYKLAQEPDLNGLLRMPGVMSAAAAAVLTENPEELEGAVLALLESVLERFDEVRKVEGAALAAELRAGMERVAALGAEASKLREGVAAAEFARLKSKMAELLAGAEISEDRLLAEAALLAGRGDVEEELVRLRTHVDRFTELLEAGGEVGRQLDFLLQEMNREANTALSKTGGSAGAAGLRLTEIGLAVKVELERAREQVQNLE